MCQWKYEKQPEGSNLCGAYAMAYWMKERQDAECDDVVRVAKSLYREFQFNKSDFQDQNMRSELEGYCNPAKMMKWLMEKKGIACYFKLGDNPIIQEIFESLHIPNSISVFKKPFSLGDSEDEQVGLEVVDNGGGGLHYLYVYRDGERIKAIDPSDGCVHDRAQLEDHPYIATGSGIIIN